MSSSNNTVVYWGTGRRKTSVARVRLVPGNGTITINGRPGDNYLNYNPAYLAAVKAPLQTLGLSTEYDVSSMCVVEALQVKLMRSSKELLAHSANFLLTIASHSKPKVISAEIPVRRNVASTDSRRLVKRLSSPSADFQLITHFFVCHA